MQTCIICLEEATNLTQINHCGAYYVHKKCHSKWKTKNNTCIVCREPLAQLQTIVIQEYQDRDQQQQIQTQTQTQTLHINYRIINTIQFKIFYTIVIVIITLITAYIFFIW
jgi:hypothetical protein